MTIICTDYDPITGIKTKVHKLESRTVIQKSYDSQPFLDVAKDIRAATDGQKWGEMRHVGFVPMAELATMMRQDGRIDQKRVVEWVKANPAMCTFEKLLK